MSNNIERLIELYGNDVLRIANIYLKNSTIAEDIFQEVFIKVMRSLNSFKGNCTERTWIIRITINTCKDYLKSAWKTKITSISEDIPVNSVVTGNLINSENKSFIVNEILNLPPKYKDVLILYYYQSFSTIEIAKILSIPEPSVRTRMKRAREMLKDKLKIVLED